MKTVEEPLFKSYVFVKVSEEDRTAVRMTPGVINFVYLDGKPAIIKEKEIAARKMEEAKAANADDSALGSIYFAELGREVQGYKGVDISDTGDDKLTIQDTAKSLAAGKTSVGFKKRVKKPMANRASRTTSADD